MNRGTTAKQSPFTILILEAHISPSISQLGDWKGMASLEAVSHDVPWHYWSEPTTFCPTTRT